MRLVIGFGGAFIFFIAVIVREKNGLEIQGFELLFLAFVYGMVGAIELITGTPFQQFANGWTRLGRWQQLVVGTSVIAFGSLVVVYCVWILFRWLK